MKKDLRITEHFLLNIERGEQITFLFDGKAITAYSGETVAAALYAAGIKIFSRSFKYHRPRGLFCLHGHCSHCLMRVDGVPNVRTCVTPVRTGMKVESQNAWPSLKFDIAAMSGYLDFLIRPGFQYRRFIKHRFLYHVWERFLRRMGGIGSLSDPVQNSPSRRLQAVPEVVIVGGGIAGLSATLHAAGTGAEVWLIEKKDLLGGRLRYDTALFNLPEIQSQMHGFSIVSNLIKEVEQLENCRIVNGATAFAWYDEGILSITRPAEFWELRPQRVIIATGTYETPIVFENNDLPGIFLAGGLQRLMHGDFIRPGKKAVVVTDNDRGYAVADQLLAVGVAVAGIVDHRPEEHAFACTEARKIMHAGTAVYPEHAIQAAIGRRNVKGVIIKPRNTFITTKPMQCIKLPCDVLCTAVMRSPANDLVFQRTCQGTYVLESPHQFSRRPLTSSHMQVDADMYVAGEASGSQRVEQSWLEGKIAGLSAALDLGYGDKGTEATRDKTEDIWQALQA